MDTKITKATKSNNNAKAVMALKHKEKCTLKEAWAKYKETQPKPETTEKK